MPNDSEFVKIDFLAKKYRNIRSDLQPVIAELQQGNRLGDRLVGFGSNIYIYKVRVANSNIQKGKSAGYRIIYLLESETSILLLTIYSKSQQEDIEVEVDDIQTILNNFMEMD
jgi:mRNA-degrading endonuclease RelE of RelBE toxin-antitoxin system